MFSINKYVILAILFICSASVYSDTYDFGQSFWVDDYAGIPADMDAVYSYRIFVDGVQVIEVIDAATPTIADVITAADGVAITVQMRNGNGLIPVADPSRYAAWTAQIPVSEAGLSVPVTTWSIRVVHGS